MVEAATFDTDEIVDGQRFGPRSILFLLTATLILVTDGFDLAAMGYIGPELLRERHWLPGDLVAIFSAGIVGLMVGAPVIGFLGDRFGRKRVILAGLCLVGTVTLGTMAARSVAAFTALRFVTGVGLGGIIPNVTALVAELAPRPIRGRLLVIVNLGVAFGIALPGLITAAFVPRFGWRILLLVGGLLPLAVGVAAAYLVPESLKYLVAQAGREAAARRLAQRMRPDLAIAAVRGFHRANGVGRPVKSVMAALFAGDLARVTPLLWVCNAANQMANFFALTWLPTLLQSSGSSTSQAGLGAALFSIGGVTGGLALLFIIDHFGVVPMLVLFAVGTPLVAAIGLQSLSPIEHGAVIAGAGLCVTGINFSMSALLGIFYPTAVRSLGTGWTQSTGRFGALAAPLAGGFLLAAHVPPGSMTYAPAVVLGVGALSCAALAFLCIRRFGGLRVDEFAVSASRE